MLEQVFMTHPLRAVTTSLNVHRLVGILLLPVSFGLCVFVVWVFNVTSAVVLCQHCLLLSWYVKSVFYVSYALKKAWKLH